MPNKYEVFVQNNGSLQRKFVAGGLAAAFGAGEFGGYAAAMKENFQSGAYPNSENDMRELQIEDNSKGTE